MYMYAQHDSFGVKIACLVEKELKDEIFVCLNFVWQKGLANSSGTVTFRCKCKPAFFMKE